MFRKLLLAFLLMTNAALAQVAELPFGASAADPAAPIEILADSINLSRPDGTVEFTGSVKITQGELTLTAGNVVVYYKEAQVEGEQGRILRMVAEGGVTLVSGRETASAGMATYDLVSSQIVLSGGVKVVQGQTSISGDHMTIDIKTGKGRIEGNVRTVLSPSGN